MFRLLRKQISLSLLLLGFIALSEAQTSDNAIISGKLGKGLQITTADKSLHLKFEARFQSLYEGKYDLNADLADAFRSEFSTRRARLKFSGYAFNPGIEYKVELGMSNKDIQVTGKDSDYSNIILDAYLRFKLAKNLKLRVGQFKMPGNRERVVSSGSLQLVDRSIVNSKFNIDRDAGMMLEHKMKIGKTVFKEMASISVGEGRNRLGNDEGMMYAGRVEFMPFGEFGGKGDYVMSSIFREESPKLSVGFSASYNDNAKRSQGQGGNYLYESRDLVTLNADFMFKWQGFSAYGEYGNRMTDNPITTNIEGTASNYVYAAEGYNVQAGYMFKSNWEIAARYSSLHPDESIQALTNAQTDYTIGVSKFIVGHNLKVQADLTYTETNPLVVTRNETNNMVFRVTTNLNF